MSCADRSLFLAKYPPCLVPRHAPCHRYVRYYPQGHLEFFICDSEDLSDGEESIVTQGCFNMHPLDRAADDDDASPIDPNHKGRYFVDPPCRAAETDQTMTSGAANGDVVTARYQLPDGLTCSRCIIQMVYCKLITHIFQRADSGSSSSCTKVITTSLGCNIRFFLNID